MWSIRFKERSQSVLIAMMLSGIVTGPVVFAQNPSTDNESVIPINQITGRSEKPVVANLIRAGDSSRKARQEAADQLPIGSLTADGQREVQQVLKDLSLFRRLPTLQVEVDPRAYEFFTDHPDVAVSIWRALDISNVQMKERTPVNYVTDTSDGTIGTVDVLLRSPTNYLVLCQGQLQSPGMPKPITAKALMHLQPRFDNNGKVTHHLDLFVSFPSQTVETLAKLTSPVSFRIADRNFEEVSLFMGLMSRAMAQQPGWVEQTSKRLEGVDPQRPTQLLKVTASVYVDAERKRLTALGIPVTAETIRPVSAQQVATEPQSKPVR
ncbi:hypothetical protein SH668x_002618 [Planctomicrobium sp. SH668]|uniref:hypothetical protein n=1 Tax=Planctomicrobium sp. SH668 TaxID=3448126 RepID=UPI003F5CA8C5